MNQDKGSIAVGGVSKSFGGVLALRDVSLEVHAGEFLTLLGPSGCGKTTLLRLIAGFEQPDRGAIRISGRDVAHLPPYKRPVNTVFQHYALFPHRDVLGNVAFGLETLGLTQAEVKARALRALELVRLPGFEHRRIEQLSGGQQQRVALARAVVLEPEVLLLDEPMSALDLKLRKQMQVEVKHLQQRLKTTFVFVTHDQDEALVMSDRIAVMSSGVIEQLDTPERLYEQPRTRFVADFLAVRNLLSARVVGVPQDGHVRLRTRGGLELLAADDGGYAAQADVCIGVRPERIRLGAPGDSSGPEGTLDDELYLGDRTEWRVRAGDELLTVAEDAASAHGRARGDRVRVSIPPAAVLRLEDTVPARQAEATRS